MAVSRWITLGLALATGCVALPPDEGSSAEIATGMPSQIAAVGTLSLSDGARGGFCTATSIAPRVVVSARSCLRFAHRPEQAVFRPALGGADGARAVAFFFDGTMDEILAGPAYVGWSLPSDLVAVVLERDVGTDHRPWRSRPMDDRDVGRTVVLVGFGPSAPETFDHGGRLMAASEIGAVTPDDFTLDPATAVMPCYGDLGGPVFLDGEVSGLISEVVEPSPIDRDWLGRPIPHNCRPGVYTRVDRHARAIEGALARAAEDAVAAEPCTCDDDPRRAGASCGGCPR